MSNPLAENKSATNPAVDGYYKRLHTLKAQSAELRDRLHTAKATLGAAPVLNSGELQLEDNVEHLEHELRNIKKKISEIEEILKPVTPQSQGTKASPQKSGKVETSRAERVTEPQQAALQSSTVFNNTLGAKLSKLQDPPGRPGIKG